MHLHSVLIPRNRLDRNSVLNEQNPVLSWPLAEPEGGLLFRLWSELLDRLPNITTHQAASLAEGFLGFIDGLLSDETEPGDADLLQSMEQFLQRHLRENISAADLCRQFHLSRATVYRSFAPHGGVRAFIDRARLHRVRMELLHADPARTKVAEIASSWGYYGASTFSRRFRKQFGQTPSQALHETLEAFPDQLSDTLEGSASIQAYTRWLDAKGHQVG
jgi:AraC-like DNA-binding protein